MAAAAAFPSSPGSERTRRIGPRPFHPQLMPLLAMWMSSRAALPILRQDSPGWSGPLESLLSQPLQALRPSLAAADLPALDAALDRIVRHRIDALLTGIERYRSHPAPEALPAPRVLWEAGTARLLDYGGGNAAPPLLFVPSLVNRYHVLDLSADASLLRWLAARGRSRVLVLDWQAPGEAERHFGFDGYVLNRLSEALDVVAEQTGRRPILAGYCMGGLLSLALAQHRQADLAGLMLIATPWDFHNTEPQAAARTLRVYGGVRPFGVAAGELPVDAVQMLFAAIDPLNIAAKFIRFGEMPTGAPDTAHFVAVEQWLNDGIPLAMPVADAAMQGWYGDNTPFHGGWQVGGRLVEPQTLTLPVLLAIPDRDRIVPPASAMGLARQIPATHLTVAQMALGHVGMIVSRRAPALSWPVFADWAEGL